MNKAMLPLSAGYILKNEFMIPFEISGYRLAHEIGVAQITISNIINNKRRITPDIAIRLSKFFKTSAEFWLNLQDIYELKIIRKEKHDVYKQIKPMEQTTRAKHLKT